MGGRNTKNILEWNKSYSMRHYDARVILNRYNTIYFITAKRTFLSSRALHSHFSASLANGFRIDANSNVSSTNTYVDEINGT